jgi:hypothetical protein
MNYREQQLRQIHKNQVAKLQQTIQDLETSTDYQEVQKLAEQLADSQRLLDETISVLGSEDINNLSDLKNLLQGKTLKELVNENTTLKSTDSQQKINDLENKLADTQGELKKTNREKESLLKTREEITTKLKDVQERTENLLSHINKGVINKN